MNIAKYPVARQRIALELHPQAMTHRAVCPVAADQPGDMQASLHARPHFAGSTVTSSAPVTNRNKFDLPLHPHAAGVQMLLHQPFSFVLRKHERVRMRRLHRIQADMADPLLPAIMLRGVDLEAGMRRTMRRNPSCP